MSNEKLVCEGGDDRLDGQVPVLHVGLSSQWPVSSNVSLQLPRQVWLITCNVQCVQCALYSVPSLVCPGPCVLGVWCAACSVQSVLCHLVPAVFGTSALVDSLACRRRLWSRCNEPCSGPWKQGCQSVLFNSREINVLCVVCAHCVPIHALQMHLVWVCRVSWSLVPVVSSWPC